MRPNTFSGLRALASESVLRRGIMLMPRCANLRASGNIESLISRKESKRLMTAKSITTRCCHASKRFT